MLEIFLGPAAVGWSHHNHVLTLIDPIRCLVVTFFLVFYRRAKKIISRYFQDGENASWEEVARNQKFIPNSFSRQIKSEATTRYDQKLIHANTMRQNVFLSDTIVFRFLFIKILFVKPPFKKLYRLFNYYTYCIPMSGEIMRVLSHIRTFPTVRYLFRICVSSRVLFIHTHPHQLNSLLQSIEAKANRHLF